MLNLLAEIKFKKHEEDILFSKIWGDIWIFSEFTLGKGTTKKNEQENHQD